jgi:hypothetical protein
MVDGFLLDQDGLSMRLTDHDEDGDGCTLVFLELLAFLALGDAEARDYLSWLDTDGTLTEAAITELGKAGIIPLPGFRPLAILTLATSYRNSPYFWSDPAPFIPKETATPRRNFEIRISVSRVYRVLDILCWLSFSPADPPESPWGRRLLKLYRRYQQSGDTAIHSGVFDAESFLVDPLWQAARAHARRIMELLGMTGCKPSQDIYALSMEFED